MSYTFSEHPLVAADVASIADDAALPWHLLSGCRVLVTGGTGLIGSLLVKALLYHAAASGEACTVVVLTRRAGYARELFAEYAQLSPHGILEVVEGDVNAPLPSSCAADYVIHAASVTDSATMVNRPVETIMTTVVGTRHVLECARQTAARGCLFLSSMEVYGHPEHELVREGDMSGIRSDCVRSSYPLSKLLSENLCCAYAHEYGVPTRIARLTLTFGPGIPPTDRRVFAQFARAIIKQEDIVLLTEGRTQRDYLYTADAVRALLAILLRGESGGIYNVSNPDSYVSIRELAEHMRRLNPAVQVVVRPDAAAAAQYASEVHIRLDNRRLEELHPFARTPLPTMVERLAGYLREPQLTERFEVKPTRA